MQKLMRDGDMTMNLIFDNLENHVLKMCTLSLVVTGSGKKKMKFSWEEGASRMEVKQNLSKNGFVCKSFPVVRTWGEFFKPVMFDIKFKVVSCSMLKQFIFIIKSSV